MTQTVEEMQKEMAEIKTMLQEEIILHVENISAINMQLNIEVELPKGMCDLMLEAEHLRHTNFVAEHRFRYIQLDSILSSI